LASFCLVEGILHLIIEQLITGGMTSADIPSYKKGVS
jgi:hypothetical protein